MIIPQCSPEKIQVFPHVFPITAWLHLVSKVFLKDGLFGQGSGISGYSLFRFGQTSHPGSHDPFSCFLSTGRCRVHALTSVGKSVY